MIFSNANAGMSLSTPLFPPHSAAFLTHGTDHSQTPPQMLSRSRTSSPRIHVGSCGGTDRSKGTLLAPTTSRSRPSSSYVPAHNKPKNPGTS